MNSTIQVFARNVYGNDLIYPSNDQAQRMAMLLKCKTFTVPQLQVMLDMGFTVEHILDPKLNGKIPGVATR